MTTTPSAYGFNPLATVPARGKQPIPNGFAWSPQATFSLTATPRTLNWQRSWPLSLAASGKIAGSIAWSPQSTFSLTATPKQFAFHTPFPPLYQKPPRSRTDNDFAWNSQARFSLTGTPTQFGWNRSWELAKVPPTLIGGAIAWAPSTSPPILFGWFDFFDLPKQQGRSLSLGSTVSGLPPTGLGAFDWYKQYEVVRQPTYSLRGNTVIPALIPTSVPSFDWYRPYELVKPLAYTLRGEVTPIIAPPVAPQPTSLAWLQQFGQGLQAKGNITGGNIAWFPQDVGPSPSLGWFTAFPTLSAKLQGLSLNWSSPYFIPSTVDSEALAQYRTRVVLAGTPQAVGKAPPEAEINALGITYTMLVALRPSPYVLTTFTQTMNISGKALTYSFKVVEEN